MNRSALLVLLAFFLMLFWLPESFWMTVVSPFLSEENRQKMEDYQMVQKIGEECYVADTCGDTMIMAHCQPDSKVIYYYINRQTSTVFGQCLECCLLDNCLTGECNGSCPPPEWTCEIDTKALTKGLR